MSTRFQVTVDEEDFLSVLRDSSVIEYILGRSALHGSPYSSYYAEVDDKLYLVGFIGQSELETVQDESVVIESSVIVVDRVEEKAWFVPADAVSESSVFPELRESFGGSYEERDANYEYHFSDGTVKVAVPAPNPVSRLDEPIEIVGVEFMGGLFPRKWILEAADGSGLYLRERSGSIRLYDKVAGGDLIFKAFIGGEHPGTTLRDNEVLNIVTSVEYINLADAYDETVSSSLVDSYFKDFETEFSEIGGESQ